MPCVSPLKGYQDRDTGGLTFRRENGREKMEVACGQCLGCRLDYRRMWAVRIAHEATMHEYNGGNCFITLTYRDEDMPNDWSVHKEHYQKFMKRLRHEFPQRIKYYAVGEYGRICKHGIDLDRVRCPLCNVGRPHYHACLFNCDFNDRVSYAEKDGIVRYTSPTLEKVWPYGDVDVGELNFQSAAYVSGYVTEKVTGKKAKDYYRWISLDGQYITINAPFALMSRGRKKGEGIGASYYKAYKEDFWTKDGYSVPGHGVMPKEPRYYDKLLEADDAVRLGDIKLERRKFRKENGSEYTPDRLMAKYKVMKANKEMFGGKKL